jgi:ParB/RepB/Spo0J family partition protein
MSSRRRATSPILRKQVAGGALGQIMAASGASLLPEARPSLRQVPLEQIVSESDLQTRASFDPEHDIKDAELVESVRSAGIRIPIHLQDQGNGTYHIRSGHRRVSAAREAGLERIPAIVWPAGADVFDSALDTWLENLHRKDLLPLERAEMLSLLMQRFGLRSSPESAERLGLSTTSFYRYLGLLGAPEDVKQALRARLIGVARAEKLAGVADDVQRAALIEAAWENTAPAQLDEALVQARERTPLSKDLSSDRRNGRQAPPGSRRSESGNSWAGRTCARLAAWAGLNVDDLTPIARALQARRLSAAEALAVVLLIIDGESVEPAIKTTKELPASGVRALHALFKALYPESTAKGFDVEREQVWRLGSVLLAHWNAGQRP